MTDEGVYDFFLEIEIESAHDKCYNLRAAVQIRIENVADYGYMIRTGLSKY